jgi:hypothetical protein
MRLTLSEVSFDQLKKVNFNLLLKTFIISDLENHQPFEPIDLDVIRLCFQLFLEDLEDGRYAIPMCFVVSEPIYDKKAATDLVITKLSHCSASCYGGQEVILLCEKVS